MCLDRLFARYVPAWRQFFDDQRIFAMTPEQQSQANRLDQKHRALQADLKTWGAMTQPIDVLSLTTTGSGRTTALAVPIVAWLAFRAACIQAIRDAIAENREQYAKL